MRALKISNIAVAVVIAITLGHTVVAWAISQGTITVNLLPLATIPTADGPPLDVVGSHDGTGRIFVATRNGDIDVYGSSGVAQPQFLNMANAGVSIFTGGEGGLLGLAFSPNYSTDGLFYTFQTETWTTASPAPDFSEPEIRPTTTTNPSNQTTIREWHVSPGNPSIASTSSRVLIRIYHPQNNHQGGGLRFGPDGYLYISIGDGGGGNDFNGSATSSTDGHNNTIGNGQDTTVTLGKILRIKPTTTADANTTLSTNGQYRNPNNNPFTAAGNAGLDEIYAYGLRNPFRFSFDATSGKLFVGDVGQDNREEVDVVTNGGNYGWPFREGTRDNSGTNGSGRTLPGGFTSLAPIAEYTHSDGRDIIGGYIYHGPVPELDGKYVFGDELGTSSIGRLFYMDATGGVINELKYQGAAPNQLLFGFGEVDNGNLYALFGNGSIVAIVPEPSSLALGIIAVLCLVRFGVKFRRNFETADRRLTQI